MTKQVYLDYAAATPLDPAVAKAMQPYLSEQFYNPSATYAPAVQIRKDLETARAGVAHWLGAKPSEIIFTAGATEANNLAIRGIMDQFPDGNLVVSAIEHESVLTTAQSLTSTPRAKGRTFNREGKCELAPVTGVGIIDVDALVKLVDDRTVLVSVMYANNEVGTIQPLGKISQALQQIRNARKASGNKLPLYFHTDAAQAAAYLDLHVSRLGVDMLTLNAGKLYGPKQVGCLFVASHVALTPQITGGGQERNLRSGTENVAGAVGLATALELVQSKREDEVGRLRKLQQLFFDELTRQIPDIIINGSRKARLPNNVHITIPGADNERLLFMLDEQGVLCAAGSACSADSGEPSHVLKAMGLSDEQARASLRFSMGRHTTEADVVKAVHLLKEALGTVIT